MAIDWDKINRRFWRLNRIEQETYARFQMQNTEKANERTNNRISDSLDRCDTDCAARANLNPSRTNLEKIDV